MKEGAISKQAIAFLRGGSHRLVEAKVNNTSYTVSTEKGRFVFSVNGRKVPANRLSNVGWPFGVEWAEFYTR